MFIYKKKQQKSLSWSYFSYFQFKSRSKGKLRKTKNVWGGILHEESSDFTLLKKKISEA